MRSKKPDLESVLAEFERWRAKPCGRLIPDKLWRAAVELPHDGPGQARRPRAGGGRQRHGESKDQAPWERGDDDR